jgi:hypothetical protein
LNAMKSQAIYFNRRLRSIILRSDFIVIDNVQEPGGPHRLRRCGTSANVLPGRLPSK